MSRSAESRADPADAVRITRYGDGAWLVSFDEPPSARTARRAQALALAITTLEGPRHPVAGIASVLVPFDPLDDDAASVRDQVAGLLDGIPTDPAPPATAREHEIPVRYGGADGPDLDDVAIATGRTPAEVVARHAAVVYEVFALGFAPGFAYLGELDPAIRVPRLATPRSSVPPGSVAIADALTGIYPAALPGGWRILGRTDRALFDARAREPAVLRPGDRVRFVDIR